mmetsp:Transcript_104619/g.180306  ORF Transcript_104619/g.180306 Transcript_104619/m.180306 type:complete len:902 (-) Transcript_104619:390-3095(-)
MGVGAVPVRGGPCVARVPPLPRFTPGRSEQEREALLQPVPVAGEQVGHVADPRGPFQRFEGSPHRLPFVLVLVQVAPLVHDLLPLLLTADLLREDVPLHLQPLHLLPQLPQLQLLLGSQTRDGLVRVSDGSVLNLLLEGLFPRQARLLQLRPRQLHYLQHGLLLSLQGPAGGPAPDEPLHQLGRPHLLLIVPHTRGLPHEATVPGLGKSLDFHEMHPQLLAVVYAPARFAAGKLLDGGHALVEAGSAHVLGLLVGRGVHEHLRLAHLQSKVVNIHELDHLSEPGRHDQSLLCPVVRQEDLVPLPECLVRLADGEALLPDGNGLQHACALHLGDHPLPIEHARLVRGRRLDAPDPVRLRGVDGPHQDLQALAERAAHRGQVLLALGGGGLLPLGTAGAGGQEVGYEGELGFSHDVDEGGLDGVHVLVAEPLRLVPHLAGVVGDPERAVQHAGLVEELVALVLPVDGGQVPLVAPGPGDLVVKEAQDASGGLQELQGRTAVWGLHRDGVDALVGILVQIAQEHALVVVLLELLVAVINQELLEEVLLKHLKAEDVEQADPLGGLRLALLVQDLVDAVDDVLERGGVHGLGQGIPDLRGLLHRVLHRDLLVADVGRGGGDLHEDVVGADPPELAHKPQRLIHLLCRDALVLPIGPHVDEPDGLEVHDPGNDGVDEVHLVTVEADGSECRDDRFVVLRVLFLLLGCPFGALEQPLELHRVLEAPLLPLHGRSTCQQLVERVERPLARGVGDDSAALQQVVGGVGPMQVPLGVELQLHVLPEAGAVVVPLRLGIPKRLEDGAAGDDLVHQAECARPPALGGCISGYPGEVVQHHLGPLRLAGSTLPGHQHALWTLLCAHVPVCQVGHGPMMGRQLGALQRGRPLLDVERHAVINVERKVEVEGVDS